MVKISNSAKVYKQKLVVLLLKATIGESLLQVSHISFWRYSMHIQTWLFIYLS